jgi:hypothetical protein
VFDIEPHGYGKYPDKLKLALMDIAFNTGVDGLKKFAKMKKAIDEKPWTGSNRVEAQHGVEPSATSTYTPSSPRPVRKCRLPQQGRLDDLVRSAKRKKRTARRKPAS